LICRQLFGQDFFGLESYTMIVSRGFIARIVLILNDFS